MALTGVVNVTCDQDCKLPRRNYGQAALTASVAAANHAMHNPGHTVTVTAGGRNHDEPYKVIETHLMTRTLPTSEEPPF